MDLLRLAPEIERDLIVAIDGVFIVKPYDDDFIHPWRSRRHANALVIKRMQLRQALADIDVDEWAMFALLGAMNHEQVQAIIDQLAKRPPKIPPAGVRYLHVVNGNCRIE